MSQTRRNFLTEGGIARRSVEVGGGAGTRRKKNYMTTNIQGRKVDKKKTKQVRIDTGIHQLLKVEAAKSGRSIKSLLEGVAAEALGVINEE